MEYASGQQGLHLIPGTHGALSMGDDSFPPCGRLLTPELSFIAFESPLLYPFSYSRFLPLPDSDNSVATRVNCGCSQLVWSIAPVRGAHRPQMGRNR